jgi:hypothetical protein
MKIYHYTSINNLALILQSRSIRFSDLLSANDKLEGITKDYGTFGKYVLVSCWTKNSAESLPLWNMYTDKMRGVRIELPLIPFETKNWHAKSVLVEPFKDFSEKGDWLIPDISISTDVEYTDDPKLLTPSIKIGDIAIEPVKVGKYKSNLWSFEEEIRFRIYIFPKTTNKSEEFLSYEYKKKILDNRTLPAVNCHYINIADESFKSMRIVTGPRLIPGDSEIVSALMHKYNPEGEIVESELRSSVR